MPGRASERTPAIKVSIAVRLLGLFDVTNIRDDDLLHGVIYPVVKNEVIAHELENLSSCRIRGAKVRHEKWIGRQFINSIQNRSLPSSGLPGEETRLPRMQKLSYSLTD